MANCREKFSPVSSVDRTGCKRVAQNPFQLLKLRSHLVRATVSSIDLYREHRIYPPGCVGAQATRWSPEKGRFNDDNDGILGQEGAKHTRLVDRNL